MTYWSFRLMIGYGLLTAALLALADLWMTRQRIPHSRWFYRAAILALPTWPTPWADLHRDGTSPWTVFGVLQTSQSVSAGVSGGTVLASLIVFTVLYAGLAVVAAA